MRNLGKGGKGEESHFFFISVFSVNFFKLLFV